MERKKVSENIRKIKFPIGEAPPDDPELTEKVNALMKKHATITEIFKAIAEWEPGAVRRDREAENTKLSGRLTYKTVLRRP
jgi:hypothetical protein